MVRCGAVCGMPQTLAHRFQALDGRVDAVCLIQQQLPVHLQRALEGQHAADFIQGQAAGLPD